ncbi:STAS domain-containing protein [Streptomyces luteogriseus]|uniref:STAS domain-containing protein n=1 Tax=Streptomyces luteogriseus TaxID=68233 RepID=UPI00378D4C5B
MPGEPSIETTISGCGVVARVCGDMDYVTVPGLWARFKEVLADAGRFIVLDLTGVSFCDSAGLSVLIRAARKARLSDADLVLACVPPSLRRILDMTGADQVLPVYGTVAQAQAGLEGQGNEGLAPLAPQ